jgi:hypothetical protein
MEEVKHKARNQYLILKGILAEKCGLEPELYKEVSEELDKLVSLMEADIKIS